MNNMPKIALIVCMQLNSTCSYSNEKSPVVHSPDNSSYQYTDKDKGLGMDFAKFMSVEEVEIRLSNIHKGSDFILNSGPLIKFTSGRTWHKSDVHTAVRPWVESSNPRVDELVEALGNDQLHIRYAAVIALEHLTNNKDISYNPNFAPDSDKNMKGRKLWEEAIKKWKTQKGAGCEK